MASTGLRSYLAGTGASGSLLLAALVALVSVTAFVGFDAVPFGSGDAGAGTVSLERSESGATAAAAAAAAVGGAPAAVAAVPVAPAAAAGAPAAASGAALAPAAPGTTPAATGVPGAGSATQTDVPPAGQTPTAAAPTNPVDDLVAGVDNTVQSTTGTNPNLGGATKPVTGALDQTLQGLTGNDLGGHLGNLGIRPQP